MNAIFIDFPRLLSYFCCVLLCGLLSGCGNGSERSEINGGTNHQVRVNQSHAVSATNETPSARRVERGAQSNVVGRTNDSRPSVSSAASASLRNVKLFPTDAVSVVFEGNAYDYDQAMLLLPTILQSTNSLQKKRWYYAISEFRTKLQGEPVSKLIDAFGTEADPVVREAILNAVEFSRDSRFPDLCLSAQNDSNPNIRLRAGALLIDQGQLAGVEVISGCLASLGERGQRNGLIVLSEAANKFHFPYVSDKSIIESNLPERKKIELLVSQWSKWWKENKTEYSRRPQ